MMMKKHITRTLIASAVLFSFNSTAATSYFEARNDAMGGTGVASSHYGVAPLANPALLTKSGAKDDFSLLLPSVGAQLSDPGNITDNADKISDDWKAFERAVDAQSGVPQTAARLKAQLQDFRHTHADAQVGASAVAALPGDTLAAALMLKTFGTVSVDGKVSDADLNYLESIANSNGQNVDKNRLTSQAFARAALVTDVGIALATELETAGQNGHWASHQNSSVLTCSTTTCWSKIMTAAHSKVTATTTRKMASTPTSAPAWTWMTTGRWDWSHRTCSPAVLKPKK